MMSNQVLFETYSWIIKRVLGLCWRAQWWLAIFKINITAWELRLNSKCRPAFFLSYWTSISICCSTYFWPHLIFSVDLHVAVSLMPHDSATSGKISKSIEHLTSVKYPFFKIAAQSKELISVSAEFKVLNEDFTVIIICWSADVIILNIKPFILLPLKCVMF